MREREGVTKREGGRERGVRVRRVAPCMYGAEELPGHQIQPQPEPNPDPHPHPSSSPTHLGTRRVGGLCCTAWTQ